MDQPRRGFTLIELLVVVAVIALLISIMLPSLGRAREQSRRTKCAAHLHAIGQGLATYLAEFATFPTQPAPGIKFAKWSLSPAGIDDSQDPIAFTYTDSGGGIYPQMGDPMANMWIMVLDRRLSSNVFVCPSDPLSPIPAETRYTPSAYSTSDTGSFLNFGAAGGKVNSGMSVVTTYSYSFAYPWISGSDPPAPWWRGFANSTYVLGADIGPSVALPLDDPTAAAGTKVSNSKNHGGSGQNVLFADFRVDFATRNDVGPGNDNIYTTNGGAVSVKKAGKQFTATTNLNTASDPVLAPARP